MLDIENGNQHQQKRESKLREHLVNLFRNIGPSVIEKDTQQNRHQHQQKILLDKIAHRQGNTHVLPYQLSSKRHYNRNGKKRDDAAKGRKDDRQGNIAAGKLGKDIGRTTSRAAGNEHKADEKHRWQLEKVSKPQCYRRQQYQLAEEGDENRLRMFDNAAEVSQTQGKAKIEHQQSKNRQYNPNSIHLFRNLPQRYYKRRKLYLYSHDTNKQIFYYMKLVKIIGIFAVAATVASCGSNENKTLLKGVFTGDSVPEEVHISNSEKGLDTLIAIKDGKFSIELDRDKTTSVGMDFLLDGVRWDGGIIPDCATITYTLSNEPVSIEYSDTNSLNIQLRAFMEKQNEIREKVKENPDAYDEMFEYAAMMFENNPDNFIGYIGYLISSQGKSDDEKLAMIEKLSPEIQAKPAISSAKEVMMAAKTMCEGVMFKDFEVEQPDGSVKKFSDYVGKGKYVLVDFWASWCGPCLGEIPYLKAAYKKYKGDKFDILGVAVSDKPENTLRAIQEKEIPWNVILNAQKVPGQLYGFNTIPQIFLFGPDGTLLKRDGLRGDDMDKTLAEYLKK